MEKILAHGTMMGHYMQMAGAPADVAQEWADRWDTLPAQIRAAFRFQGVRFYDGVWYLLGTVESATDVNVPKYQRPLTKTRMDAIANKPDKYNKYAVRTLCMTIRDGKLQLVDGQHRRYLLATRLNKDKLPVELVLLPSELSSEKQEAKLYQDMDASMSVKASDVYKAALIEGATWARNMRATALAHNYVITGDGTFEKEILNGRVKLDCTARIKRLMSVDSVALSRVLELLQKFDSSASPHKDLVSALFRLLRVGNGANEPGIEVGLSSSRRIGGNKATLPRLKAMISAAAGQFGRGKDTVGLWAMALAKWLDDGGTKNKPTPPNQVYFEFKTSQGSTTYVGTKSPNWK